MRRALGFLASPFTQKVIPRLFMRCRSKANEGSTSGSFNEYILITLWVMRIKGREMAVSIYFNFLQANSKKEGNSRSPSSSEENEQHQSKSLTIVQQDGLQGEPVDLGIDYRLSSESALQELIP